MRNETTNHEPANAAMSIGRRRALRQIGLLAAAAYSAPVLLQVSQARASGGSAVVVGAPAGVAAAEAPVEVAAVPVDAAALEAGDPAGAAAAVGDLAAGRSDAAWAT